MAGRNTGGGLVGGVGGVSYQAFIDLEANLLNMTGDERERYIARLRPMLEDALTAMELKYKDMCMPGRSGATARRGMNVLAGIQSLVHLTQLLNKVSGTVSMRVSGSPQEVAGMLAEARRLRESLEVASKGGEVGEDAKTLALAVLGDAGEPVPVLDAGDGLPDGDGEADG